MPEIYWNWILLKLQICGWQKNISCRLTVFIVHCCLFYRIKQRYTANVIVLGTKHNRFLSLHSQATCFANSELSLHVLCRGRVNQFACSMHRKKQLFKYHISRPIRRTFFPEKRDLNSTCVLCAKGKYYFQTYKYLYMHRVKTTIKMILVEVTTIFWVSMKNNLYYDC